MLRAKRHIAIVIFLLQTAGLFTSVHFHAEDFVLPIFHNELSLANHHDADRCKHIPVSHEKDCAVCTQQLTSFFSTSEPLQSSYCNNDKFAGIDAPQKLFYHFIFSVSRRGPPSFIS